MWLWLSKPMVPFRAGAPPVSGPILVGIESDVDWGYGLLTHGHVCVCVCVCV